MAIDEAAVQNLIDKDAIRELVLLYSRAIDRKDIALLRDLYTDDATDQHGDSFEGTADEFCEFIGEVMADMQYFGHHACNHLISVEGDEGCGEVYALAYHIVPDPENSGARLEFLILVRYFDTYRRCADGKWRFSSRVVTYDVDIKRPFTGSGMMGPGADDPSYEVCRQRLFQRGPRA